jgi:hypothetical protein
MGTITFAGASGVYVPEEDVFEVVGDGTLNIDGSGRLYSLPNEESKALRYMLSTADTKIATVLLAAAGNTEGVLFGPAILTSTGNGYAARMNGGVVTLSRIASFSGAADLDSDSITIGLGGDLVLSYNTLTGALEVTSDGVSYLTATDSTYTTGLGEGVIFYSWTTTAQGITSLSYTDGGDPPPDVNPIVVINLKDRNLSVPEDDTGYTVVLRETETSTAILYQTGSGAIVDGAITIDNDAVGDVDDEVFATVHKAGATRADDLNASGYVTVIDGNEE